MTDAPRKKTNLAPVPPLQPESNNSTNLTPDEKDHRPIAERQGQMHFLKLISDLTTRKAQYVKLEDGSLSILVTGERIPINLQADNLQLNSLMLHHCKVTIHGAGAKCGIYRLLAHAESKAGKSKLRKFSGWSDDFSRLFIPVASGGLKELSVKGIRDVVNGDNVDNIWIEHPKNEPFRIIPDSTFGLELFEKLCVETQACAESSMKWFVAMHEGLFPYVRELCANRFIVVHVGASQKGKTTGVQRFTYLHGLGEVTGDFTVASLNNLGDIGLLAMDNKEQSNFTQGLLDFCLYLSTGAMRGRTRHDGTVKLSGTRPVGVITSIEGVFKNEFENRCVEIPYETNGKSLGRGEIEYQIKENRGLILTALLPVLQRFLQIKSERREFPSLLESFDEHSRVMCELLTAYGEIAQKPLEWAANLIIEWKTIISSKEKHSSELEFPIISFLKAGETGEDEQVRVHRNVKFQGKTGILYVINPNYLISRLKHKYGKGLPLPVDGRGLSRRLGTETFTEFLVVKDQKDPEVGQLIRKTTDDRFIGLFIKDAGS